MEKRGSFYDAFMSFFEKRGLGEMRREVLAGVSGSVLEIGPGTGVNLRYCDAQKVEKLTYLDLKFNQGLLARAQALCKDVEFVRGSVENMPFEDGVFHSVVFTLVLCSVGDQKKGLEEIRRVLKPSGTVYFIEHIAPPGGRLKGLFNRLNPFWRKVANGCNLNRDTLETLSEAGFEVEILDRKFNGVFVGGLGRVKGDFRDRV